MGNKVTRAYYQTDLLDLRRPMMARWESYVAGIEVETKVVLFNAKADNFRR